ncbi:hypothetical protein JP74_02935 [Devosia sp. 17-2-E-8]|nr:hypothetical protein JP74_02935 [Devosia sp. 17-2-E-8]
MAKTSVDQWDEIASNNTDIGGTNIDEGCAPSGINNAIRAVMAQLKAWFKSSVFRIWDAADVTKKLAFDLSGIATGTTRTLTIPDESGRLALQQHLAGYLYGLTLSNNAVDFTNDIDVAVGNAIDSTGAINLALSSAITKRLDAAWAVGSGNGGRMSAAAIADTTYHVFLIRRPDTGVVDVGFDVSPTAPTLPANYTQYRRIGSIMRVSGAIRGFVQRGDNFYWSTVTQTGSTNNPGTSAITGTAAVPLGVALDALLTVTINNASASSFIFAYVSSLAISDQVPTVDVISVATGNNSGNTIGTSPVRVMTNASGQFRWRLSSSTASITFSFSTVGFIDTRGQI